MGAFYAPERIGPHRHKTPDGFLVCYDVPIARTGTQEYSADEIGLKGDASGRVVVNRDPDEVFRPDTIDSANGKPVTNEHPPDGILLGPHNWADYAVGEVHNPRRGEGIHSDLTIADLVIKDRAAIEAIEDGKTEVSCGYDCDYEQNEPGRGRQHNIMINHVALVDAGRCGPRCAVLDAAPSPWQDYVRSYKTDFDRTIQFYLGRT
jgi:uncharacterized protein